MSQLEALLQQAQSDGVRLRAEVDVMQEANAILVRDQAAAEAAGRGAIGAASALVLGTML